MGITGCRVVLISYRNMLGLGRTVCYDSGMALPSRPCDHCGSVYEYRRLRQPGYCSSVCRVGASRDRRRPVHMKQVLALDGTVGTRCDGRPPGHRYYGRTVFRTDHVRFTTDPAAVTCRRCRNILT